MKNKILKSPADLFQTAMSRRSALKLAGAAGLCATFPSLSLATTLSSTQSKLSARQALLGNYPDWVTEARIHGLSINGPKLDPTRLELDLDLAAQQGANVIEADSRLSDYLTDEDFNTELLLIKESVNRIHAKGLKVVWYIPSLEVITPNGRVRADTIAKQHPDWLQLSFDRQRRGVFYGQKVFWVEPNDESAWMCPNSPYRDWFKFRLQQLASTGVDGIWLDVPLFGLVVAKWGCADKHCRSKFEKQTGIQFPTQFDVADKRFRRYMQWRHETLTEFIEDCQATIKSANSNTIAIAEVVALDHLGAVEWGTEGSSMRNNFVVWEQDAISEATAMADAGYDDWIAQYCSYKYFRGATMDRPSWAFCYGYKEPDAQLVMAGAIAAQNNPYELRTPRMTTTVGRDFRGMMYRWITNYSKPIFRSTSIAPVAVIHSERNRDFLDALHSGGMVLQHAGPTRGRRWLGNKEGSPKNLTYMGDYRGISVLLYQLQIPTDIFPFSRINAELLASYKVIFLPYMASLSQAEKNLLLEAVKRGSTLIVSGPQPGMWDDEGNKLSTDLWSDLTGGRDDRLMSVRLQKGRIFFWRELIGQQYLRTHDAAIPQRLLSWLNFAGVEPWVENNPSVIVQPYAYGQQILVHVLNYSWVGNINNLPKRLKLTLKIPWQDTQPREILQSEPNWSEPKSLSYKVDSTKHGSKLTISLEVGINALVLINKAS